jgi:hypothetical protein
MRRRAESRHRLGLYARAFRPTGCSALDGVKNNEQVEIEAADIRQELKFRAGAAGVALLARVGKAAAIIPMHAGYRKASESSFAAGVNAEGGITRASEILNISQPGVSQRSPVCATWSRTHCSCERAM